MTSQQRQTVAGAEATLSDLETKRQRLVERGAELDEQRRSAACSELWQSPYCIGDSAYIALLLLQVFQPCNIFVNFRQRCRIQRNVNQHPN
jgi:hypothetical protein